MTNLLLAIESATDWLSVALLEGERVIVQRRSEQTRQHAAALLPTIDATFRDAGIGLDRIDALGVSAGPGSFTSLRIGLATAKGLALGRELRAIGISTLEAMAVSVLESTQESTEDSARSRSDANLPVIAMLDARRGEWYAGGWRRATEAGGLPRLCLDEGLYSPARLAESLEGRVDVVSPEASGWESDFEATGLDLGRIVAGESGRPEAAWIGRLAQRRLAAGEGGSARSLTARYLRRAQAEANRLGAAVEAGIVSAVGDDGRG